ncbi:sigma-70 family RNA polymerase sigma factor [Limobrevibacterium gyesilva]|uniref:RNA polymerase sigma factor n=1 Tax=Limobrevibacterium gyesilva TaxID=2991712 RepID=A0AA41YM83_9PROT|nr:sigma-70 family RNA polymerase sigma factor [Limobrevibacterium gyesilva]MCW3474892.1 sigma-70 family RNA polymerase sigma factor [Limobrevibacterium gyesilva]
MTDAPDVRADLLAALPKIRAFAISLCGRSARADDLVQETLMKAWANLASFEPGSNMVAWLYTILRNEFYTDFRKRRHEVADTDGQYAARLSTRPLQEGHMQLLDVREALDKLAPDHREALILVGASGLSYEEAAKLCGCAVGTMKSRANRARAKLAELLTMPESPQFGDDEAGDAVVDTAWTASSPPGMES